MKKIGVIMEELGFNKDAPDSAKEAFIRHLIKVSVGADGGARAGADINAQTPEKTPTLSNKKSQQVEEQMSFAFVETRSSKKAI